jgi:hypothetical protein
MGNSLTFQHRHRHLPRRRWSCGRFNQSESASFDFRASEELLCAGNVTEDEEVPLGLTLEIKRKLEN